MAPAPARPRCGNTTMRRIAPVAVAALFNRRHMEAGGICNCLNVIPRVQISFLRKGDMNYCIRVGVPSRRPITAS